VTHLDPVVVMVRTLLANTAINTQVSGRIYGGSIPQGALAPLILVRSVARRPTTRPTTQWWDMATVIDVQSTEPSESFQIAAAVEDAVNAVVGSQPEGVVASCEVTGSSSIEDGAYTPVRYRTVLTVEVTARNN